MKRTDNKQSKTAGASSPPSTSALATPIQQFMWASCIMFRHFTAVAQAGTEQTGGAATTPRPGGEQAGATAKARDGSSSGSALGAASAQAMLCSSAAATNSAPTQTLAMDTATGTDSQMITVWDQVSRLCGMHAMNAMVQSERFRRTDLDNSRKALETTHPHLREENEKKADGLYELEEIWHTMKSDAAIELDMKCYDPDKKTLPVVPDTVDALLVHTPNPPHFKTIYKTDTGLFFNLDSLPKSRINKKPRLIPDIDQYVLEHASDTPRTTRAGRRLKTRTPSRTTVYFVTFETRPLSASTEEEKTSTEEKKTSGSDYGKSHRFSEEDLLKGQLVSTLRSFLIKNEIIQETENPDKAKLLDLLFQSQFYQERKAEAARRRAD
jgi:hypothetical protein